MLILAFQFSALWIFVAVVSSRPRQSPPLALHIFALAVVLVAADFAIAAPLEKRDGLRKEYSRAAFAADQFIAACDAARVAPDGLPAMLYLGALARYTLGEYPRSLELIERIRRDYPDYKRDQFLNDRDARVARSW